MPLQSIDSPEAQQSDLTAQPDLSVIIVCLNNRHYLQQCLASLYAAEMRYRFEVIAVDNASTDGSQAMLADLFPKVRLIQNQQNAGLSRATNQGISAAEGRYLLLLNDDTLVNGASLDAMVEFLDECPQAGAAGGKLLNADGSLQAGYAPFPTLRDDFVLATGLDRCLWAGYPTRADASQPRDVDWLGSACLLLRREALAEVGLLDEQYFIYGDEVDLQYRLHERGWSVYYLPAVSTIHFGGRSMDRWRRRKMVYRGKMLFYRKNYDPVRAGLLRLMFGALSLAKLAIWGAGLAAPPLRGRAQLEVRSNLDVLRVCKRLA